MLSKEKNTKAVSVVSPPQVTPLPPTLLIGFRRVRLLTISAALRSPQTCFRLPHCLGCFAACGFPRPPALRDADYRRPPVIVLPLRILLIVVVVVCLRHCVSGRACASIVLLFVVVILLYCYLKGFNGLSIYTYRGSLRCLTGRFPNLGKAETFPPCRSGSYLGSLSKAFLFCTDGEYGDKNPRPPLSFTDRC